MSPLTGPQLPSPVPRPCSCWFWLPLWPDLTASLPFGLSSHLSHHSSHPYKTMVFAFLDPCLRFLFPGGGAWAGDSSSVVRPILGSVHWTTHGSVQGPSHQAKCVVQGQ